MSQSSLLQVLAAVARERFRQHEKWGEQHHPDGTGPIMSSAADYHRECCEAAFKRGVGSWADILLEEVYEAVAEDDPEKLVTELTHVAAVAVSWIEDIRSRPLPSQDDDEDYAATSQRIVRGV